MSVRRLIAAIFLGLSVLVIVGEWIKRDLKSRLERPRAAEIPPDRRGTR